jgi:hypothetical protein
LSIAVRRSIYLAVSSRECGNALKSRIELSDCAAWFWTVECGTLGVFDMPTRFLFFINRPDPNDPEAVGSYNVRWHLTPPNGRRHEIGRARVTDPGTIHPMVRPGGAIPPSQFVDPPPPTEGPS